jgi:amino acid transporter
MILLLMLLGAILVGLVIFMIYVAVMIGVVISLTVYALSYLVLLLWASFRHRSSPEWKFEKKLWKPDLEDVQTYSLLAGIASAVWMVVGFLAYAFSDGDWSTTIEWVVGFTLLCGIIAWMDRDDIKLPHREEERQS